jgi:hypothetical protein
MKRRRSIKKCQNERHIKPVRIVYFFPEVETGIIPVVGDVIEIEKKNRPESILHICAIILGDEVVGKGYDRRCTQGRSITLWTTPWT